MKALIGQKVRIDCLDGPFFGVCIGYSREGPVDRIIYRRNDGKVIRHWIGQVTIV